MGKAVKYIIPEDVLSMVETAYGPEGRMIIEVFCPDGKINGVRLTDEEILKKINERIKTYSPREAKSVIEQFYTEEELGGAKKEEKTEINIYPIRRITQDMLLWGNWKILECKRERGDNGWWTFYLSLDLHGINSPPKKEKDVKRKSTDSFEEYIKECSILRQQQEELNSN